jgi:hypothetical protein
MALAAMLGAADPPIQATDRHGNPVHLPGLIPVSQPQSVVGHNLTDHYSYSFRFNLFVSA